MSRREDGVSEETALVKRQGGQLTEDGEWLVLTESEMLTEEGGGLKGWKHSCGETVMVARVHRPVWDGPFKGSGSGQVRVELVPYCPKCEVEPNWSGPPIDLRVAIWGDIDK